MDGVLADFDKGYEQAFGVRPNKLSDDVVWEQVRAYKDFYRMLPPMPDLQELWVFARNHNPIILTGVPSDAKVPEAQGNKEAWVRFHLGSSIEVRCVRSSEKCLHAKPGDILVDDWEKHKPKWLAVGGIWITHVSASESIRQLKELGL
jgi:hypothetical protein